MKEKVDSSTSGAEFIGFWFEPQLKQDKGANQGVQLYY